MIGRICVLAWLLPLALGARELDPWYGNELELELRGSYLATHYEDVSAPAADLKRATLHHQLVGSAAINVLDWAAEAELGVSESNRKPGGFEFLQVTGRHRLLNDVWEDPISLTIGATARFTGKEAREDVTSYFHGRLEGEAHFAFGQETACGCEWRYRHYAAFGAGVADRSRGWIFGEAVAEGYLTPCVQGRVFVEGRHGLGERSLETLEGFETYSLYNYRWAKVGTRVTALLRCGAVSLEYAKGVYSKNAPDDPHYVMLRWYWAGSPV